MTSNNQSMDLVYLDNNATTQPAPEVVQAMLPYLSEVYGNPSSIHRFGQRARHGSVEARGGRHDRACLDYVGEQRDRRDLSGGRNRSNLQERTRAVSLRCHPGGGKGAR